MVDGGSAAAAFRIIYIERLRNMKKRTDISGLA